MDKPKKQLKNFRLSPELIDRLERAAKIEDISQTTLVKQAIQEKVTKVEKNNLVTAEK